MYRPVPDLPWPGHTSVRRTGRRLAAALLRRASTILARLALSVAGAAAHGRGREPVLEFYAEAGAPEGALYVDGELVGMLLGVSRL
jgi:hypothetical protein